MSLATLRLNLGDTTGPGRVGEILIRPLSSSNDTSIWTSTKAARLPLKYSDPVHAPSDPAYSPEYTLLDGTKYPKVTQGAYYEFTVVRVNNTTDGATFEAQIPATATVDFDDLAPTVVPLPTPLQLVDSAVDLALRTGALTHASLIAAIEDGVASGIPLLGMVEKQPLYVRSHSWGATASNNVSNGRIHERLSARLLMGATTMNGVSGRTAVDLANLSLGGAIGATARLKAFLFLIATINDLTLHGVEGAPARRGYGHAWRAMLSAHTASGIAAADSASFVYDPTFTSEAVSGTAASAQGATVNSTSGTRWKTTTVGAVAELTFTGPDCDVFLVARVAGAGLVTFKEGATTLGTLDLTATVAQDGPAIFRVRGRGAGTHVITATLTSGASMTIDSVRIPSTAPAPGVVLGEPPVVPSPTDYAGYLTDLTAYKSDLATIVAEFPSLKYIDLDRTGWDGTNMLVTDSNGGHKHPNDYGAGWITTEIIKELADVAYSGGLGTTLQEVYPAVYTSPSLPVPAGMVDGTGSTGVSLTVLSGGSSVRVDWSRLEVPAGTTSWSVRYRIGAGSWTVVPSSGLGTTKDITGLTSDTVYEFAVAAVNGATIGTYSKGAFVTPHVPVIKTGFASRYRASDDATAAGVAVTSWADTGTANVPMTAVNGPTKRTSPFAYMEFDGVNDNLSRGSNQARPKTIFIVGRFRSGPTGTTQIISTALASTSEIVGISSTGTYIMNNGTALGTRTADNGWHVFAMVWNDASSSFTIDGQTVETGTSGTNVTNATWALGRASGAIFYAVDIAEVIAYGTALSDADRIETAQALRTTYGIA